MALENLAENVELMHEYVDVENLKDDFAEHNDMTDAEATEVLIAWALDIIRKYTK